VSRRVERDGSIDACSRAFSERPCPHSTAEIEIGVMVRQCRRAGYLRRSAAASHGGPLTVFDRMCYAVRITRTGEQPM